LFRAEQGDTTRSCGVCRSPTNDRKAHRNETRACAAVHGQVAASPPSILAALGPAKAAVAGLWTADVTPPNTLTAPAGFERTGEPSRVAVVDVDDEKGGADALHELERENDRLPRTRSLRGR